MKIEQFLASLADEVPPKTLNTGLVALWHDAKGNWQKSHGIAQADHSAAGAWVHGYLHRAEGDLANARVWYGRAGQPFPDLPLAEEWALIAAALLKQEAD